MTIAHDDEFDLFSKAAGEYEYPVGPPRTGHRAGWDEALRRLARRSRREGWIVRAALRFALRRMGARP